MRILVGVAGSIAAYRSVDFVKDLVTHGHEVRVILTAAANELVSGRAISTFTDTPVVSEHDPEGSLAAWAEVIVIYAATADFLSRYAQGRPVDRLTMELLYAKCPVLVAPAMNPAMWSHDAVQANVATLLGRGVHFEGPISGEVACGETGLGHIAEIEAIREAIERRGEARGFLAGKKFLISVGPMRTPLDPVRFVQNRSSGMTGLEIAKCARNAGAEVEILLGPVENSVAKQFESFVTRRYSGPDEYGIKLGEMFGNCDVFMSLSAVLDFEFGAAENKIPRSEFAASPNFSIPVKTVTDYVAKMAALKGPHQCVIAFAAETGDEDEVITRASQKMERKKVDALVANPVWPNLGPEATRNQFWVLRPGRPALTLGPAKKSALARPLLEALFA